MDDTSGRVGRLTAMSKGRLRLRPNANIDTLGGILLRFLYTPTGIRRGASDPGGARRTDQRMRPWQPPEEPVSTHRPCRAPLRWRTRRPRSRSAWAATTTLSARPSRPVRPPRRVDGHPLSPGAGRLAGGPRRVRLLRRPGRGRSCRCWLAGIQQPVRHARAIIERDFSGLGATALQVVVVDHHAPIASDPQAQAIVSKATHLLKSDHRVSTVVPPQAGISLSRDGRTA